MLGRAIKWFWFCFLFLSLFSPFLYKEKKSCLWPHFFWSFKFRYLFIILAVLGSYNPVHTLSLIVLGRALSSCGSLASTWWWISCRAQALGRGGFCSCRTSEAAPRHVGSSQTRESTLRRMHWQAYSQPLDPRRLTDLNWPEFNWSSIAQYISHAFAGSPSKLWFIISWLAVLGVSLSGLLL